MAQTIQGSGNILVPFNDLNALTWDNSLVIGLDDPDTVFGGELDDDEITIISSGGGGLINGWTVQAGNGNDEVDLYGSPIGVRVELGLGNDEVNIEDNGPLRTVFLNSTFLGGDGEDFFDAEVDGNSSLFDGGADDDYFSFQKISTTTVYGGTGNDDFYLEDFTTKSLVEMQDGDDYLRSDSSIATTTILGGIGNDGFIFFDFNYLRRISVEGGEGNDYFDLEESHDQKTSVKFSTFKLGDGADTLESDAGTSLTTIQAGSGDDLLTIQDNDTLIEKSLISLDEGDDQLYSNATLTSATISGGTDNDTIIFVQSGQSHSSSSIVGGSGNDYIHTNSSDLSSMTIDGGDNNDTIYAAEYDESIVSSSIAGGSGDDTITSNSGSLNKVTIAGGSGKDEIYIQDTPASATITDSFIYGNADEDLFEIYPDISNSYLGGGNGHGDFHLYGDSFIGLSLYGGDGNDTVSFEAPSTTPTVSGSDFRTGASDDRLYLKGGFSTSNFMLGSGDDLLEFTATPGGFDTVTIISGTGHDTITDNGYALSLIKVSIASGDGNDVIDFGNSTGDSTSGISLSGGEGNDSITSTSTGKATITGAAGDDSIFSFEGNDLILAGAGVDAVEAGYGDDMISGGSDIDALYGDVSSAFTLGYTGGKDTIYGGTGNDLVFAGLVGEDDEANSIYGDVSTTIVGGAVTETLTGVEGADILVGGNNNDTIYAYANTTVAGAGAKDTVVGAGGNDTIVGSATGANWLFGDVYETASTGASNSGVAFADIDFVSDSGLDFRQVNASLSNSLTSTTSPVNTGVPSIFGGSGESIAQEYAANNGLDSFISDIAKTLAPDSTSGSGIPDAYETASGGYNGELAGADSIVGGNGGNVIFGGGGNDIITTGSGVDVIIGGEGGDSITGGSGNDLFIQGTGSSNLPTAIDQGSAYTFTFNNGVDVITDFKTGTFGSPLETMAFEGWNADGTGAKFINNLGSPLGEIGKDAIVVFSGNYNAGNNTFATTTSTGGADVLVLLGTADVNIGDLDNNISASGNQTVILLGAGSSQSISVSNFI